MQNNIEKSRVELEEKMTRPQEIERLKSRREKSRLKDGEEQTVHKLPVSPDKAGETATE